MNFTFDAFHDQGLIDGSTRLPGMFMEFSVQETAGWVCDLLIETIAENLFFAKNDLI